jgi:hypothetical protein
MTERRCQVCGDEAFATMRVCVSVLREPSTFDEERARDVLERGVLERGVAIVENVCAACLLTSADSGGEALERRMDAKAMAPRRARSPLS